MNLKGNTVLITGGSSGLGLEFARRFAELGNTVIITGRDPARLHDAKKQVPGIHTIQSDVSDPAAIQALYAQMTAQFPELNMLINNAGEMRKINLNQSIDLQDLTREIDINLSGPVRMTQQFLPHLKSKQTAAIVNVTSGLALVPFPISPIYGATKAGLRAYTKALRVQLKNTKIKVFELVAPAARTPLAQKFTDDVGEGRLMDPVKLINVALKGISNDQQEIYPGMARIMKIMSRLAPSVLFNQLSKASEKALLKS